MEQRATTGLWKGSSRYGEVSPTLWHCQLEDEVQSIGQGRISRNRRIAIIALVVTTSVLSALGSLALLPTRADGPDPCTEWSSLPSKELTKTEKSFPVSVEGRNILDRQGRPWFAVGDSPWSLIAQLTTQEITCYLKDRASKGFRVVMFNAPEWSFVDTGPGRNRYGDAAFTGDAFASPLNDSYWQVVDHAVGTAESLGLTVLICPAYLGAPGDGVKELITNRTNDDLFAYGYRLGIRYRASPNLMWLAGHDTTIERRIKERYGNLQDGMEAAGDHHLWVPGEANGGDGNFRTGLDKWSGSLIPFGIETVYDYSMYRPTLATIEAWRLGAHPVIYLEGRYENEHPSTRELRHQAWGSFVGGANVVFFGNRPVWYFGADWRYHLDSLGAVHMSHLATVMRDFDWSKTEPDLSLPSRMLVGANSGNSRPGARVGIGLAAVYQPASGGLWLELSSLGGEPVDILRLDPTNGKQLLLLESVTGRVYLGDQGLNDSGDSDWVFLAVRSDGKDAGDGVGRRDSMTFPDTASGL